MLQRLKAEVIDREIEACLPSNLSDEWLSLLADSADAMLGNECVDEKSTGAACLAVIWRLMQARSGTKVTPMEASTQDNFLLYRMELAFEEIHRKEGKRYVPATVETILTERDVEMW